MRQRCPCGLKLPLEACCGRYISGAEVPETAAELMRSRYTAYCVGAVDYLLATTVAARRAVTDRAQLADYCAGLRGVSLKILEADGGGPHDDIGVVVFEARLSYCGRAFVQRERSNFVREDGRWVYVDGQVR